MEEILGLIFIIIIVVSILGALARTHSLLGFILFMVIIALLTKGKKK